MISTGGYTLFLFSLLNIDYHRILFVLQVRFKGATNDTEAEFTSPEARPTFIYHDYREVCKEFDPKKDKLYPLPIYRRKSKEYHEEVNNYRSHLALP